MVLLALAVLAASVVHAQSERDIYDIMYLPKAGTSYGFTTATWVEAGRDLSNLNTNGYVVEQTLGHALTDDLSLQIGLNYGEIESRFGGEKATSLGVSDPTFSGRYRVMDETFRFDLLASVLIGPGAAEQDADGDTNRYNGGAVASLGAQFGQKQKSFQWAVSGIYSRHFKAGEKFNGEVETEDAYNAASVSGDLLFKVAEPSIVRTYVSVDFSEQHDSDGSTSYSQGLSERLGLEYQHVCSKNFLFRIGGSYFTTQYGYNITKMSEGYMANVGANYQF